LEKGLKNFVEDDKKAAQPTETKKEENKPAAPVETKKEEPKTAVVENKSSEDQ
jgi:hypothetical protein